MPDTEPTPRAVTFSNRKGGVGKTALSINVAERLSTHGYDVLLADVDPAGNATEGVGLVDAYDAETHLGHVILDEQDATIEDVIYEQEWFDVIPSHRDLGNYQRTIEQEKRFDILCLEQAITGPLLDEQYDYILFDTPASLEDLFSDAALVAAQNVIIPLFPSEESIRGFERMLDQQINPIRKEGRDVNILALVPNQTRNDNEFRRQIDGLEEHFPEYLPSFARSEHFDDPSSPGPGIRERVDIRRAWRNGQPLAAWDPESDMLSRFGELARIVEFGDIEHLPAEMTASTDEQEGVADV